MTQAMTEPMAEALDPVERRLLPVLRCFLAALQASAGRDWRQGYDLAAEVWGEGRGLAIAHRTQAFVGALLQSRGRALTHGEAFCPEARETLTTDERMILSLLAHIRADETREARHLLALLTAGRIEGAVVHAALSLCALLEGRQTPSRSGAAVRLAVVPGTGAA